MERIAGAFGEFARTGLGPRRGAVELLPGGASRTIAIDLGPQAGASQTTVRFLTPTELKGVKPEVDGLVPFEVLFARLRDRVSALATLYGGGPLAMDFRGMARRAAEVRTVSCFLLHRGVMRTSSRTGQTHGIGGFTGTATYEGDLTEFMPFLRAAWWTGVGRHTVWGNGMLSCE